MGIQISPSILNADFAALGSEIERISSSADWVHVDVMDAHFVPNLTVGLPVVESLSRVSTLPLDAHLMIENPEKWGPAYAEAGAKSVTFHVEAADDPRQAITAIRQSGARVGMAIKPVTPASSVVDLVPLVDMVLVMTVEPGFGGQSFMADMLPKVQQIRSLIRQSGGDIWLQVDGGVSLATIESCAQAGADVFVAGSAVYRAEDPAEMVDHLRALAEAASSLNKDTTKGNA